MNIKQEAEKRLTDIINKKIDYRPNPNKCERDNCVEVEHSEYTYDGFDMSGLSTAAGFFENVEIVSRFKSYFKEELLVLPIFWKGAGTWISFDATRSSGKGDDYPFALGDAGEYCEFSGWTTVDIIFKLLTISNPAILENIRKEIEEERSAIDDIELLYSDLENETKEQLIKKVKRDTKLVKELKEKYISCQLCQFTFKKKDGKNYNEIHHIIPLTEKGKDEKINTLVLCANCHRKLHYATTDFSKIASGIVIINKEEKTIKR